MTRETERKGEEQEVTAAAAAAAATIPTTLNQNNCPENK